MATRPIAMFIALAAFTFVSSVPSQSGERLTEKQTRKLFPGTFSGTLDGDERKFTVSLATDGLIRGHVEGKVDEGRWSIEGGKLCVQWKHWEDARKNCQFVERQGPWFMAVKEDGDVLMKFKK